MPPKLKFTRDEIVEAAFELLRARGASALTAREVGAQLGVSSSPIFTAFRDMEALKDAVRARAWACFNEYMKAAENFHPAYKKRGMQWVKFAQEQPNLFRFLFMHGLSDVPDFASAMQSIAGSMEGDIAIIMSDYHTTHEQAARLSRQMWIYCYGLCSLCAAKICYFTEEELAAQLGEIFGGIIFAQRAGVQWNTALVPAESDGKDAALNPDPCAQRPEAAK